MTFWRLQCFLTALQKFCLNSAFIIASINCRGMMGLRPMKDIVVSTCIILAVAMFAVAAERWLAPAGVGAVADVAGFAARHLASPAVFVLHRGVGAPAVWL